MTRRIHILALMALAAFVISTQTGCIGLVSAQRYGPATTKLKDISTRSQLLQKHGGPDKVIKGDVEEGKVREDIYIYRRISGMHLFGIICYTTNWDLIAVVQDENVVETYSAQKGRGWTFLGFVTLPIPPPVLIKME